MTKDAGPARGLPLVREQMEAATAADKCHVCGCFRSTLETLEATAAGRELEPVLSRARAVLAPEQYDCLGCPVCYPAIAANALAEDFPGEAPPVACPTDSPRPRAGWPSLPGDYHVVRYGAPAAVCTLNSHELAASLAAAAPEGLSIAGTLHTENLGIERLVQNVLGNPNLRFLILCGEDTEQAIGHLPGQSLASLFAGGLDERGRIRGARGKRPVLKNISRSEVEAFVERVELVDRIGALDAAAVAREVAACAARDPGPFERGVTSAALEPVSATEPRRLVPDPAGYFVVYPEARRGLLLLEHYTNDGVLDALVEGSTPAALYAAAIERQFVTRLDHAAYLGRELTRAEHSLRTGEHYVQDRAPGELEATGRAEEAQPGCGCASGTCGSRR